MKKAVFLDRDGVINREMGDYVTRISDFEILPHALSAIKQLLDNDFLVVVITNQGGIAKGLYRLQDLNNMHELLRNKVHELTGHTISIYYCPHHPDFGKCLCRKPDSLLVERALARYDIDAAHSYFIGDRERDMQAAEKAGVKGLLIASNQDWQAIAADIISGRI
jgi:D-glycero-D-manno-heptose 1,7-bisphosphate phosphatase